MQVLHEQGTVPDYEGVLRRGYSRFIAPGATVIDIGAHQGAHFDTFRQLVGATGRVVGFEPVPAFADMIRARHGSEIDLRQMALSTQPGEANFLHMTKAPGESGFRERRSAGDRGVVDIKVRVSTLDAETAELDRVDFIKLDIEGSEINCLTGGQRTIERHRPYISVEYGRPGYSLYGLTAGSLYDWSKGAGYRISDLFGNLVADRDEWTAICDRSYWDYFLVPREKTGDWQAFFA